MLLHCMSGGGCPLTMSLSPFFPRFNELPLTLPVFPLENVIIMPGAELPLNVFESRYLNMVQDVLKAHHMIGMVQPDPSLAGDPPPLFQVGCAGRITSYSETHDGRILLTLTGLVRFRIQQEIPAIRGYRMVVPSWEEFALDLKFENLQILDRAYFVRALGRFLKERNLEIDWEALGRMPDIPLIHMLATLLPLDGADKQTILETLEPHKRADALLASLEIAYRDGYKPFSH